MRVVRTVREALARHLGLQLQEAWAVAHARLAPGQPYEPSAAQSGCRELRNLGAYEI